MTKRTLGTATEIYSMRNGKKLQKKLAMVVSLSLLLFYYMYLIYLPHLLYLQCQDVYDRLIPRSEPESFYSFCCLRERMGVGGEENGGKGRDRERESI